MQGGRGSCEAERETKLVYDDPVMALLGKLNLAGAKAKQSDAKDAENNPESGLGRPVDGRPAACGNAAFMRHAACGMRECGMWQHATIGMRHAACGASGRWQAGGGTACGGKWHGMRLPT